MRRRSQPVSLSFIAEVREITVSARTRERSAITSSVSPSAKYALSGSGLRLANGSTTMPFFVGAAAAGLSGASSAARNSGTVRNRSAAVLDNARSIARHTGPGTPGRSVVSGGTGSSTWRASTAPKLGPVKGGWPASSS